MFKYLIAIKPLGYMYGSAGAFLSPENLVGRSGAKFPPDAATLAGLFFSVNKAKSYYNPEDLKKNQFVAGPFWAKCGENDNVKDIYIPIPKTKIIAEGGVDEWRIKDGQWYRDEAKEDLTPEYRWQTINSWQKSADIVADKDPWQYVPILHPRMKKDERHTEDEGLFLENAVQMPEDTCLTYLSTHELPSGWYRFGGENHVVEITSIPLTDSHPLLKLLQQPIQRSFALITAGVWGSNRLSLRYPSSFTEPVKMLSDRPIPYRYRAGGRLGRGRYAVRAGSVYILEEPLNKPWWDWPSEWFPTEGYSLKQVGCGLSLPLSIPGVD